MTAKEEDILSNQNFISKGIVLDKLLESLTLGKIDSENKVDSLIVAVGHNQFRSISAKELRSFCNGSKPVIGDVKSIYNKEELIKEGFSVFRL